MATISRWLRIGAVVVMSVVGGMWVRPYALSAYHLERGGQAIEEALTPVYPDRLAPEQVADPEKLTAGIMHLEAALRLDPRDVQAMRMLARAYLSIGETEKALRVLQRASALRPRNPLLRLELGDVYDSLGYTEAAIREYEAGRVGSRSLPLAANYLKLAEAQIHVGSGDVAIGLWQKVLGVDPDNLYALYRLYQIHHELGDEMHAAEYRRQLSAIQPQEVTLPLDFRLAEYQARAMIALVEEKIWGRDQLLGVLSQQVQQAGEGLLPSLMAKRLLEVLLEQWPDDQDLLSLYQTVSTGGRE